MSLHSIPRKRPQNWFSRLATETFYALRDAQLERLEAYSQGYSGEEKTFFSEIETRVNFKDVLLMLKGSRREREIAFAA